MDKRTSLFCFPVGDNGKESFVEMSTRAKSMDGSKRGRTEAGEGSKLNNNNDNFDTSKYERRKLFFSPSMTMLLRSKLECLPVARYFQICLIF